MKAVIDVKNMQIALKNVVDVTHFLDRVLIQNIRGYDPVLCPSLVIEDHEYDTLVYYIKKAKK